MISPWFGMATSASVIPPDFSGCLALLLFFPEARWSWLASWGLCSMAVALRAGTARSALAAAQSTQTPPAPDPRAGSQKTAASTFAASTKSCHGETGSLESPCLNSRAWSCPCCHTLCYRPGVKEDASSPGDCLNSRGWCSVCSVNMGWTCMGRHQPANSHPLPTDEFDLSSPESGLYGWEQDLWRAALWGAASLLPQLPQQRPCPPSWHWAEPGATQALISSCSPEVGLGSKQQPTRGIPSDSFLKCPLLQTTFLFRNCKLWGFSSLQPNLS